jgi:hypothetical protein
MHELSSKYSTRAFIDNSTAQTAFKDQQRVIWGISESLPAGQQFLHDLRIFIHPP